MSTKVVTGKVRFSYPQIFSSDKKTQDGKTKYTLCILIPKSDKKTIAKINQAVKEAVQQGISEKWGGKQPKNLKLPLHDGNEKADDHPEFEDNFYLNASTTIKPGIVDRDRVDILDPEEIYGGCYGRVSINFFPFKHEQGSVGVAAGLNNVQKLEDGERLGGNRASAEDDFNDGYTDEYDDLGL